MKKFRIKYAFVEDMVLELSDNTTEAEAKEYARNQFEGEKYLPLILVCKEVTE